MHASSQTCWLVNDIQPSRVKPEIRDTILRYQNECDDVLWKYWTEEQVIWKTESSQPPQTSLRHQRAARTSHQSLAPLGERLKRQGQTSPYEDAHSIINLKMDVESVEALTLDQIPKSMTLVGEILERVVFKGECIAEEDLEPPLPLLCRAPSAFRSRHRTLGGAHHECGEGGEQWAYNQLRGAPGYLGMDKDRLILKPGIPHRNPHRDIRGGLRQA